MSKSFVFSNFGDITTQPVSADADIQQTAATADTSYEDGYKAGWDDAVKKNLEDAQNLTTALSENLQHIAFDYHAARTAVLEGLNGAMTEVLQKVLPAIAQKSLGPQILDALGKLSNGHADLPFEILVNPNDESAVSRILPEVAGMTVTLKTNPDLGPGQVLLATGSSEHQIDPQAVADEILQSVQSFFETQHQAQTSQVNHG
ncbi:hypothetical protein [Nereida sp. MMG025]|uniref:FliH/SctL family protein n=1 Tax=Nereida sp. MMG025 TaxID=2909981 RepID=UPI001F403758|nr:hypothetical protein [Nereida sp. MMG025]MCF6444664.1 hypothetical protein [Nereida sp. MMG025]